MRYYEYTMKYILTTLLATIPLVSTAQDANLQGLITGVGNLINTVLVPAVLAIAFVVFVINAVRFFVIDGANEEGQKNAKALALYSVSAFVIIGIFWGLVNLLTTSIGLDNDPCSNYTTSDYVIREGAPCSSPRPPMRPNGLGQPEPTTSLPTGAFSNPSVPGGAGVNLPQTDSPVNTTPPSSFTPDGDPIGDPAVTTYAQVSANETTVRDAADAYFTNPAGMEAEFGYNTNLVQSALFADLHMDTRFSEVSDLERLTAAHRLEILGAIPSGTTQEYLNDYNAYRAAQGNTTPLTTSDISQFSTPLLPALTSNRTTTNDQITAVIDSYNQTAQMNPFQQTVDTAPLFDTSIPAQERYNNFVSLYESPLDIFPDPDGTLYQRFRNDLNAELIFQGDFELIPSAI